MQLCYSLCYLLPVHVNACFVFCPRVCDNEMPAFFAIRRYFINWTKLGGLDLLHTRFAFSCLFSSLSDWALGSKK